MTLDEIEAYVEKMRGGRDVPAFDACVRSEVNERLLRYEKALRFYADEKNWRIEDTVNSDELFGNEMSKDNHGQTARNALGEE